MEIIDRSPLRVYEWLPDADSLSKKECGEASLQKEVPPDHTL